MTDHEVVPKPPSLLLRAIQMFYRRTSFAKYGGQIDRLPIAMLGGSFVRSETDFGRLILGTRDHGARSLLLYGYLRNEIEETAIAGYLLSQAHGFLDIGANYGWYSLIAASVMPRHTTRVAVEAHPLVYAVLRRSFSHGDTQVLHAAVAERNEPVTLFSSSVTSLSSTVRRTGAPITVPGATVDDLWPSPMALDFVKCDVEGGELAVLRGARQVRSRHQPIWMLEFDEGLMEQPPQLIAEEVEGVPCWWRDDQQGWRRAGSLTEVVGAERRIKNVFLVPHSRIELFEAALCYEMGTRGRQRRAVSPLTSKNVPRP